MPLADDLREHREILVVGVRPQRIEAIDGRCLLEPNGEVP